MESQRSKKSRSLGTDSRPHQPQRPIPKQPDLADRHISAPVASHLRHSHPNRAATTSKLLSDGNQRKPDVSNRVEPAVNQQSSRSSDRQRKEPLSSRNALDTSDHNESGNLNLVVVGNDGVGKSSFIRNAFDLRKPGVTPISSSKVSLAGSVYRVQLLELWLDDVDCISGEEVSWPKYVNNISFPSIDGVLCLYDVTDRESVAGVPQFLSAMSRARMPCALIACKVDRPSSEQMIGSSFTDKVSRTFPNVVLDESAVQSADDAKRCLLGILKAILTSSSSPPSRRPSETSELKSLNSTVNHNPVSSRASSTSRSRSRYPASRSGSPDKVLAASRQALTDSDTDDESDQHDIAHQISTVRSKLPLRVETKGLSGKLSGPTGPYTPASSNDPHTSRLGSPYERGTSMIPETPQSRRENDTLRPGTAGTAGSRADYTFLYMDEESLEGSTDDEAVAVGGVTRLDPKTGKLQEGDLPFSDLVRKLLSLPISKIDAKFVTIFLCLYRIFATPSQLLAGIIDQFLKVETSQAVGSTRLTEQLRYLQILGQWTANYPGDFASTQVRDMMITFLKNLERSKNLAPAAKEIGNNVQVMVSDEDESWAFDNSTSNREDAKGHKSKSSPSAADSVAANAEHMRRSKRDSTDVDSDTNTSDDETHRSISSPRHSGAPSSASSLLKLSNLSSLSAANLVAMENAKGEAKKFRSIPHIPLGKFQWHQFMDTPMDDLAQEITRVDWTMYSAIRPRDFIRHALQSSSQKKVTGRVDNIDMMVKHFNHLSFFVSGMILLRDKPKHRSKALEKFMGLAWKVRQLNNYNSLGAIVAGIGGQEIDRLGQTHELVPTETQKQFLRLKILMAHTKAYATYRMAWDNSSSERIPFIPLLKKDMTLASSASDTFFGNSINWKKFEVMGDVIVNIQRSQEQPYTFAEKSQRSQETIRLILETKVVSEPEDSADPRSELYDRSVQVEPLAGPDTKKKFDWLRR